MNILCHRGLWRKKAEQNTLAAFRRALDAGLGLEIDVRDFRGELVISHDPPLGKAFLFNEFLSLYKNSGSKGVLAINLKSDGLGKLLERPLAPFSGRYFLFDMSVPGAVELHQNHPSLALAARHSDLEPEPALYRNVSWIWMDELKARWISSRQIERHLKMGKNVAIVSPEIHGREPYPSWSDYSRLNSRLLNKVHLCTDLPEKARAYFSKPASPSRTSRS